MEPILPSLFSSTDFNIDACTQRDKGRLNRMLSEDNFKRLNKITISLLQFS